MEFAEKKEAEKFPLGFEARDVFRNVFENFCAAYFIELSCDISFTFGHRLAYGSYVFGRKDFDSFDSLVGLSRFEWVDF